MLSQRGLFGLTQLEDSCRFYAMKDGDAIQQTIIKKLLSEEATIDNNNIRFVNLLNNDEIAYVALLPVPKLNEPPKTVAELISVAQKMPEKIGEHKISLLHKVVILQALYRWMTLLIMKRQRCSS